MLVPLRVSIGPRRLGGYVVHGRFEDAIIEGQLRLNSQLSAAVARLSQPGAVAPLGDPAALGMALGRALFSPPLLQLLLDSARAAARGHNRLQIQLQIDAPELAALPWEYLTIGAKRAWSPGLRDDYALVRVLLGAQPQPPARVDGPLRVLAIAGPGEELQLTALAAELTEPIRAGLLDLHVAGEASLAALVASPPRRQVHILHCAAPAVRSERGGERLLLGQGLSLLHMLQHLNGSLRLVTLSGPQGDPTAASGSLPRLVAPNLPATLAFGGALPARLAAHFAAACYASLADGQPIDLAVTAGRRALAGAGDGRGWGMPQLYLAPGSEQLFTVRRRRRAAAGWSRPASAGAALAVVAALALGARMIGAGAASAPAADRATSILAVQPTSPLPTLTATPEPLATATPPEPTVAPISAAQPAGYATYMTAPDDTLEDIAERLGSDADAIAALNHLDPTTQLRADRPLVIPVYQAGQAGAGGLIVRRGNPAERKVALTFDIELDDKSLYAILDILRQYGLHGTFFVTGRWVQAYPDAARAIVQAGDEICNHSLTHPYFTRIGLDGAVSELQQTEQIIYDTTGVTARPYFRFPYGESSAETLAIVARQGYVAYHWSADDNAIAGWLDWAAQHPADANGGILLMHGRPGTVAALPGWISRLNAMGLAPTTLTDTLR